MADNWGVIRVSRGMARIMCKKVFLARLARGLNRIVDSFGVKKRFEFQGLDRDISRKSLNN